MFASFGWRISHSILFLICLASSFGVQAAAGRLHTEWASVGSEYTGCGDNSILVGLAFRVHRPNLTKAGRLAVQFCTPCTKKC